MVNQTTFTLHSRGRGFHLVTPEVLRNLPAHAKSTLVGSVKGLVRLESEESI